jgi:hypothetical protein
MKRVTKLKTIVERMRLLSGMSKQFNRYRPGRRSGIKVKLEVLARFVNPPLVGRPSYYSLNDKKQIKLDFGRE